MDFTGEPGNLLWQKQSLAADGVHINSDEWQPAQKRHRKRTEGFPLDFHLLEFDFQVRFHWQLKMLKSFLFHRTCYQSKSFENLQQLKRKPMITTLEGLSLANFTIISSEIDTCKYTDRMTEDRNLPR
jgi:hypothetical protein